VKRRVRALFGEIPLFLVFFVKNFVLFCLVLSNDLQRAGQRVTMRVMEKVYTYDELKSYHDRFTTRLVSFKERKKELRLERKTATFLRAKALGKELCRLKFGIRDLERRIKNVEEKMKTAIAVELTNAEKRDTMIA